MTANLSQREVSGDRMTVAVLLSFVHVCLGVAQTNGYVVPAMSGELVGVHENSISIRNNEGTRTFQVNENTRIWRGRDIGLHKLRLGDEIDLQYRVSSDNGAAIAISIWANIDRWAGSITKVFPNRVQIARIDDQGNPDGQATIILDSNIVFNEGTREDVRVGRFLEVIGLKLDKNRMQASRVLHILAQ